LTSLSGILSVYGFLNKSIYSISLLPIIIFRDLN